MKVKTDELVAEKEAKEVSEAIKDLDILTEKSKEENQNIRTLMFENLKELKEFYVICKQQIRKSFSAAMFSCFAGFMLFVLAVIIFLLGGNSSASFMAGLSGAIVEIVSGLYFGMYKETSKQLGKYHKRLEATEKYLIALQITVADIYKIFFDAIQKKLEAMVCEIDSLVDKNPDFIATEGKFKGCIFYQTDTDSNRVDVFDPSGNIMADFSIFQNEAIRNYEKTRLGIQGAVEHN